MRLPLLIIAFALLLAGCGGGGGGGGEEEGSEGIGETGRGETISVPEGVRAGAGAAAGPLGPGQESLVIDMEGQGTVIVENIGSGETSVTAEMDTGGPMRIQEGTCAKPGKVAHDLGPAAPGFVQLIVPTDFQVLLKTPHVVTIGKLCGEIKAAG